MRGKRTANTSLIILIANIAIFISVGWISSIVNIVIELMKYNSTIKHFNLISQGIS